MPPFSAKLLDKVFAMLVDAALFGERCPQIQPHGPLSKTENAAIAHLARTGRVRLEIFALNWRVITICEGEHRGRQTMRCPIANNGPYKTIQKGDITLSARQKPSAPRLLTERF